MAIQAFVTSRIDYCNAALLGLSSASIDQVQHVMNSAARLLLKLPQFSHISVRMRETCTGSLFLYGSSSRSLSLCGSVSPSARRRTICKHFATYSPQSPTVGKCDPPCKSFPARSSTGQNCHNAEKGFCLCRTDPVEQYA